MVILHRVPPQLRRANPVLWMSKHGHLVGEHRLNPWQGKHNLLAEEAAQVYVSPGIRDTLASLCSSLLPVYQVGHKSHIHSLQNDRA